ncbi:unnamed protein product, partial [Staurois parvus]
MWGDQRVNCVLFYYVGCVCFTVSTLLLYCMCLSLCQQCAGADRGEICIVYIQVSPPSVILGDRWVPAGN